MVVYAFLIGCDVS